MFSQIRVHPTDWDYQRILWLPVLNQPPLVYRLITVTYGLGPAPFLAIRVLKQLAKDEGDRFPLAVDVLERGTYVDDTFGGADSLQEAQTLASQLDQLCMAGGFKLCKWNANTPDVLAEISVDRRAVHLSQLPAEHQQFKNLGIAWNPISDSFEFSPPDEQQIGPVTKRKVLSQVAQLFDPLGWLAPVTIRAKIFMQELWLLKIDWNALLPDHLEGRWREFLSQLNDLTLISIPRWLGLSSTSFGVELHGFSDASELAMSAVLYIRIPNEGTDARVVLIGAKTKVAPLKKMTIPRLELAAATLLTKYVCHMKDSLGVAHVRLHLWTDSSVTLTWIQGHPSRWNDFVRNRVSHIQETLPEASWHHVAGSDNPADCASRGLTPKQLAEHRLWWTGPKWLAYGSVDWPSTTPLMENNLEVRSKLVAVTQPANISEPWDLIIRYSSLSRLLRITATCRRFLSRPFRSPTRHPLTPSELGRERNFWVSLTQQSYFTEELTVLSVSGTLPSNNRLNKLIPFLDSDGLLRVGGRLRNAVLDQDIKHPMILPKQSALTSLFIAQAHHRTLHGGTQATLAYLRQEVYILGGRIPVRSFILRCVRCARHRGITAKQLMGQLPRTRLTPTRPFLNTGVDYAGPFIIKTWRGRGAKTYKGYICLFVCFSTSAIHLETVTDYTTDAFIAAYKRFVGRRGICATLTSDCGTNFVGADAELRKFFSQSSEMTQIASLLANDGTEWKFNPPSTPHFGGKWEAGVKSVKYHLKRLIGDTQLTYEELSTLLTQIEAALNSRPLCPLSDDPSDLNALTPGHFLVGSALCHRNLHSSIFQWDD